MEHQGYILDTGEMLKSVTQTSYPWRLITNFFPQVKSLFNLIPYNQLQRFGVVSKTVDIKTEWMRKLDKKSLQIKIVILKPEPQNLLRQWGSSISKYFLPNPARNGGSSRWHVAESGEGSYVVGRAAFLLPTVTNYGQIWVT